MALFSPEIMAQYFESATINAGIGYEENTRKDNHQFFRTKNTVSGWLARHAALLADINSPAGEHLNEKINNRDEFSGDWTGFGKQSIREALKTGIIDEAFKAFEQAKGALGTNMTRGAPTLSPVGSSFSVGRIMAGHPKAAIIRPKSKLPPKDINLDISVSSYVTSEQIAAIMAKIAKAAWQYILAGGIVNLSCTFICGFHRPQEWNGVKHYGFIDTIKINPSNAAAFASAASGQFFRGFYLPLCVVLSGQYNDSLSVTRRPATAQNFTIAGGIKDADKVLQALKIGG